MATVQDVDLVSVTLDGLPLYVYEENGYTLSRIDKSQGTVVIIGRYQVRETTGSSDVILSKYSLLYEFPANLLVPDADGLVAKVPPYVNINAVDKLVIAYLPRGADSAQVVSSLPTTGL